MYLEEKIEQLEKRIKQLEEQKHINVKSYSILAAAKATNRSTSTIRRRIKDGSLETIPWSNGKLIPDYALFPKEEKEKEETRKDYIFGRK